MVGMRRGTMVVMRGTLVGMCYPCSMVGICYPCIMVGIHLPVYAPSTPPRVYHTSHRTRVHEQQRGAAGGVPGRGALGSSLGIIREKRASLRLRSSFLLRSVESSARSYSASLGD